MVERFFPLRPLKREGYPMINDPHGGILVPDDHFLAVAANHEIRGASEVATIDIECADGMVRQFPSSTIHPETGEIVKIAASSTRLVLYNGDISALKPSERSGRFLVRPACQKELSQSE